MRKHHKVGTSLMVVTALKIVKLKAVFDSNNFKICINMCVVSPFLNLRAWCVYIKDKMLGNYTYEDTPIIKITQIKPLIDHHLPSTIIPPLRA